LSRVLSVRLKLWKNCVRGPDSPKTKYKTAHHEVPVFKLYPSRSPLSPHYVQYSWADKCKYATYSCKWWYKHQNWRDDSIRYTKQICPTSHQKIQDGGHFSRCPPSGARDKGGLKTRDWKSQDWKTREHHVHGVTKRVIWSLRGTLFIWDAAPNQPRTYAYLQAKWHLLKSKQPLSWKCCNNFLACYKIYVQQ